MKLSVDASVCREYANCVVESPDVFDISEDNGKVLLLMDEPPAELHEDVRRAAASCPVHAITIIE